MTAYSACDDSDTFNDLHGYLMLFYAIPNPIPAISYLSCDSCPPVKHDRRPQGI